LEVDRSPSQAAGVMLRRDRKQSGAQRFDDFFLGLLAFSAGKTDLATPEIAPSAAPGAISPRTSPVPGPSDLEDTETLPVTAVGSWERLCAAPVTAPTTAPASIVSRTPPVFATMLETMLFREALVLAAVLPLEGAFALTALLVVLADFGTVAVVAAGFDFVADVAIGDFFAEAVAFGGAALAFAGAGVAFNSDLAVFGLEAGLAFAVVFGIGRAFEVTPAFEFEGGADFF
jgi:hypothetical protein